MNSAFGGTEPNLQLSRMSLAEATREGRDLLHRPTPILSEGLGGKPRERRSKQHRGGPGTQPRAFRIHMSFRPCNSSGRQGLWAPFHWEESYSSQRLLLQKATELVSRVLAQGQLAEDSFTKYTKLTDPSMTEERSRNWKNKQTIKMNKMTNQGVQRPDSSFSSLTSHTSLSEIHSCYPVPHLFIYSNSY